jgi:hypothetical protein
VDTKEFDAAARRLASAKIRRGLVRIVVNQLATSSFLAPRFGPLLDEVEAKKNKGKKRKKKRRKRAARIASCPADFPVSCADDSCCPADATLCCPATSQDPEGFCAPAGDRCCNSAQGGGSCPSAAPQCCPATLQDPGGLCALATDVCCTSEQGGDACPQFTPKCCPPTLGGGCCQSDEQCCNTTDDCPADRECDGVSGCCMPTLELESAARRSGRRTTGVRRRR